MKKIKDLEIGECFYVDSGQAEFSFARYAGRGLYGAIVDDDGVSLSLRHNWRLWRVLKQNSHQGYTLIHTLLPVEYSALRYFTHDFDHNSMYSYMKRASDNPSFYNLSPAFVGELLSFKIGVNQSTMEDIFSCFFIPSAGELFNENTNKFTNDYSELGNLNVDKNSFSIDRSKHDAAFFHATTINKMIRNPYTVINGSGNVQTLSSSYYSRIYGVTMFAFINPKAIVSDTIYEGTYLYIPSMPEPIGYVKTENNWEPLYGKTPIVSVGGNGV